MNSIGPTPQPDRKVTIPQWFSQFTQRVNKIPADINIRQLYRKMSLFNQRGSHSVGTFRAQLRTFFQELKRINKGVRSEIKKLFIHSLHRKEKFSSENGNELDDAVSLILFDSSYPMGGRQLPDEFILELLQEAQKQGYDFKAFGRDYGIGNLLYQACRDSEYPPNKEVLEFLVRQGLNPKVELERIPDQADFLLIGGAQGELPQIAVTPIALAEDNIRDCCLTSMEDAGKLRKRWREIVSYFKSL